ncbi:hypothetical protein SCLCIDRAFT_119752, partial [Scleroderma citrinum Foug A]
DPVPDVPDQHHVIGKTQNFPVDIVPFMQRHSNDPAAADFVHKLKSHLLPCIQMMYGCSGRLDQDLDVSRFKCDCSLAHLDSNIIFKGDHFYKHMIMHLNFTSYDMHHETEVLNSCSSNCNIMMLVSEDTLSDHAYCYAHVLGIFHANVIYTGPRSIDYLPQRVEFLWVWWFDLQCPALSWEDSTLDKGRFLPMHQPHAFGFVDPNDILRCCHLIPSFVDGRLHSDGTTLSREVGNGDVWRSYYVNRFVDCDMMMRYHLGLGMGHVYGYGMGTPTRGSQPDSEGAAMAANIGICTDPDVDVREGDQATAHKSESEESGTKDLASSQSSESGSVSDLDVDLNSESVTSDEDSVDFEAVMYYDSAEELEPDDLEHMYEF